MCVSFLLPVFMSATEDEAAPQTAQVLRLLMRMIFVMQTAVLQLSGAMQVLIACLLPQAWMRHGTRWQSWLALSW